MMRFILLEVFDIQDTYLSRGQKDVMCKPLKTVKARLHVLGDLQR
jgi:hypothetical protein